MEFYLILLIELIRFLGLVILSLFVATFDITAGGFAESFRNFIVRNDLNKIQKQDVVEVKIERKLSINDELSRYEFIRRFMF